MTASWITKQTKREMLVDWVGSCIGIEASSCLTINFWKHQTQHCPMSYLPNWNSWQSVLWMHPNQPYILSQGYFIHCFCLCFLAVNLKKTYIYVLILMKTIVPYQQATNTHPPTVASIDTRPIKYLPFRSSLFIIFFTFWLPFDSDLRQRPNS